MQKNLKCFFVYYLQKQFYWLGRASPPVYPVFSASSLTLSNFAYTDFYTMPILWIMPWRFPYIQANCPILLKTFPIKFSLLCANCSIIHLAYPASSATQRFPIFACGSNTCLRLLPEDTSPLFHIVQYSSLFLSYKLKSIYFCFHSRPTSFCKHYSSSHSTQSGNSS